MRQPCTAAEERLLIHSQYFTIEDFSPKAFKIAESGNSNDSKLVRVSFRLTMTGAQISMFIADDGFVPPENVTNVESMINVTAVGTRRATSGVGSNSGSGSGSASSSTSSLGSGSSSGQPALLSTTPANGSIVASAVGQVISLTFDYAVNPSTVTNSSIVVKTDWQEVIPGTVTVNGTSLTFTPTSRLYPGTRFTASLAQGLRGSGGEDIASGQALNFITASSYSTDSGIVTIPYDTSLMIGNFAAINDFGDAMFFDSASVIDETNLYTIHANGTFSKRTFSLTNTAWSIAALIPLINNSGKQAYFYLESGTDHYAVKGQVKSAEVWGNLLEIEPLSTTPIIDLSASMNEAGQILVTYIKSGRPYARFFDGTSWTNAALMAPANETSYYLLKTILRPNGTAIAWMGTNTLQHYVNNMSSNGTWDFNARQFIGDSGGGSAISVPELASNAAGDAVLCWRQGPTVNTSDAFANVYSSSSGTWSGPAKIFDSTPENGENIYKIVCGIDKNGVTLFYQNKVTSRIYEQHATFAGVWNSAATEFVRNHSGGLFLQVREDGQAILYLNNFRYVRAPGSSTWADSDTCRQFTSSIVIDSKFGAFCLHDNRSITNRDTNLVTFYYHIDRVTPVASSTSQASTDWMAPQLVEGGGAWRSYPLTISGGGTVKDFRIRLNVEGETNVADGYVAAELHGPLGQVFTIADSYNLSPFPSQLAFGAGGASNQMWNNVGMEWTYGLFNWPQIYGLAAQGTWTVKVKAPVVNIFVTRVDLDILKQ